MNTLLPSFITPWLDRFTFSPWKRPFCRKGFYTLVARTTFLRFKFSRSIGSTMRIGSRFEALDRLNRSNQGRFLMAEQVRALPRRGFRSGRIIINITVSKYLRNGEPVFNADANHHNAPTSRRQHAPAFA